MAPLLPGLCLPLLTGECGFHLLLQFFVCSFKLYELELILAEVFECKTVLHPPKCPISSWFQQAEYLIHWGSLYGWTLGSPLTHAWR